MTRLLARLNAPLTRLSVVTGLMLLLALAAVSWVAADASRTHLLTELSAKAQAQGETVRRKIERALDYGIPIDRLKGLEALHDRLADKDPHLVFLAITGNDGDILHATGAPARIDAALEAPHAATEDYLVTRLALSAGGTLLIGHDRAAVMKPLIDIRLDIATVLIVALALSFELMLLVFTINVTLPARIAERVLGDAGARRFGLLHGQVMRDELGRFAARLNAAVSAAAKRVGSTPVPLRMPRVVGVRLLAFLFVFAEELARPIMPIFFADVAGSGMPDTDGSVVAGLAMTAHMLVVAIAMPLGSALYQYVGRMPLYVGGALLATVGLAGTGLLATGLWDLVAWRAVSGLGYAATFVACQGFVIESTGDNNRIQGSAMMVSGIMLADICGPAIGGIIAGHFGAETTFLMGASVALVAALSAGVLMKGTTENAETPPRLSLRTVPAVLGNVRLMALLLLAAVPAKLVLTAFLFFLVPVTMRDAGFQTSDIGRVIMLYGMAAVVTGPLLARLADRSGVPVVAVALGGVLTAAGLIPAGWTVGQMSVVVAVVVLGIAQSLSIPAQMAAALDVSRDAVAEHGKGPVLALLRLMERLGAAAGPMVGAGLSAALGPNGAIWFLGTYAGVSSLVLLLVHVRAQRTRPA